MGEGTNGVTGADERVAAEELEQRVALIREHMTDVVSELDYRRHELFDVKGQLKKHAGLVAAIGGGVLLLTGGAIGWSVYKSRKAKAEARKRTLFGPRIVKVSQYESIWHKIASAAAGVLATMAAKALAAQLVRPVLEAGAASAPPPALPDYD